MMMSLPHRHGNESLTRPVVPLTKNVQLSLVRCTQASRSEVHRHFNELPCKAERHLVVIVIHGCTCIHSDVERLIPLGGKWNSVLHLLTGNLLAIHEQHTNTTFSEARPVVFEVETKCVPAGRERICPLPAYALEIEQVLSED